MIIPQFPYPTVSVAVSCLRLSTLVIVSPSTLSLSVRHRLDPDWPLLVSWPRFLPAVSAAQWSSVSTHAGPWTYLGLFFTTTVCWLLTLDCLITLWFPIKSVSFHLDLVWRLVLVTVPNRQVILYYMILFYEPKKNLKSVLCVSNVYKKNEGFYPFIL